VKTKILISVKTYPSISGKYNELVCTAGFKEDGSWVRIYPVPFRKLAYYAQYKKYHWIEVDLVRNKRDFRPESYRPNSDIIVLDWVNTKKNWQKRKELALHKVYSDLSELISGAKDPKKRTSLATFKPTRILDFVAEPTDRNWNKDKLAQLNQMNLFEERLKPVSKLPYNFYYRFKDRTGVESKLLVQDWEVGALYWNCLRRYKCTEDQAIQHVKNRFLTDFINNKDLYFFLGTTQAFHLCSKNPFLIIGIFYPKKEK